MPSQIEKISLKNPFDQNDVQKVSHVPPPYRLKPHNPEPKLVSKLPKKPRKNPNKPSSGESDKQHHGGKHYNTGLELDIDA